MSGGRTWIVVLAVAAFLLAGLPVWGAGQLAVGRVSEDTCAQVAAEGDYGGWSQRSTLLPPRFDCQLRMSSPADGGTRTAVEPQTALAWTRTAVTLGMPVLWAAAAGAFLLVILSRGGRSPSGPPAKRGRPTAD